MATNVRPSMPHLPEAPDADRELAERVAADVLTFEGGIGPDFHTRCNRFYRQYRSFRRLQGDLRQAGSNENDRDSIVRDARQQWGANLHIPLSFRTIETMVPRAVAQRPKLLYLARAPQWEDNVETVRVLIDSQQENIDIDLPFQAVMRAGRIFGIGFGKSYWCKETTLTRKVQRRTVLGRPVGDYFVGDLQPQTTFDDPMFEDLDVFDVMWDPTGSAMRGPGRARWVVHRIWMDLETVLDRFQSGVWDTDSAKALAADPRLEDRIRSMGNGQKYDEIWNERMNASGFGGASFNSRGQQLHEIWEWHDGHRVMTVLDRCVLVQAKESPCVGHLPFVAYRPTPLQKQMVGIGDLEPLEHLQRELDTLRSQRRDAATIVLNAGWIYDDSMIDEEDLEFGPAAAIRVRNSGDVRAAIQRVPTGDVPGSAWQDEQVIRQDFDAVSGITDALDPSQGGPASTATEAQLVQAALSARIELGSRRFEIEVVRNAARTFLALDQRMILSNRDPIRQPMDGMDPYQSAESGRWRWVQVGPGELEGEYEIIPEGGSMAARNIPQDRQDAMQLMQVFGQNPYIDPVQPLKKALKLFGVANPETWLKQGQPPVPQGALQMLQQAGVDPNLIQLAVARAQQADPQLAQQGPDPAQVQQMMGAAQ